MVVCLWKHPLTMHTSVSNPCWTRCVKMFLSSFEGWMTLRGKILICDGILFTNCGVVCALHYVHQYTMQLCTCISDKCMVMTIREGCGALSPTFLVLFLLLCMLKLTMDHGGLAYESMIHSVLQSVTNHFADPTP